MAIEQPGDNPRIPLSVVADRFIYLYWRQVENFKIVDQDKVIQLSQCTMAAPAKIIALVAQLSKESGGRLRAAGNTDRMRNYSKLVVTQLKRDVLPRLQPANEDPFLYKWDSAQDSIELLPGVRDTLRRFHTLLCDLIDGAWTRWVEKRNAQVRGSDALREHLFGGERANIEAVRKPMLDLQEGKCFYTGEKIQRASHIDHFIPFSLARYEAVGNLVVCSVAVNLKWSDRLKPTKDFRKWRQRNEEQSPQLEHIARACNLRWDPRATLAVAEWAYAPVG